MLKSTLLGRGWRRDLPDPRDLTPRHPAVAQLLSGLPAPTARPPAAVDLRWDQEGVYLSTPRSQGPLPSCCAFACLALVEYFERRALGRAYEGSPLFLHLVSKDGNKDRGLRATFKSLRRYGAPPEELLPYDDAINQTEVTDLRLLGFCEDIDPFHYFRLDYGDLAGQKILDALQRFLAAGFPVAFGMPVPRGLPDDGEVAFRPQFDAYFGGQAVVAVGYDDSHFGRGQGGIRFRNSWGPDWGESGYGWLPYSAVANRLAVDLWTIVSPRWANSGEFFQPGDPCPTENSQSFKKILE